jgi:transcriptional regulator with XRE-family HTH domain
MMPLHPLRAFREAKGLTLEQLGRVFAVDKSTVMRWEGGKIPAERVPPLSKFTGIRPHDLRPDLYAAPEPAS